MHILRFSSHTHALLGVLCLAALGADRAAADQVIADDLIVQSSECVGFSCVNNEAFGFATIRLKEDNTRIDFVDSSTTAGFPNRDWRLQANESASGGANRFAIIDMGNDNSTGAEGVGNPLLVLAAGAPANSLFVNSSGKLGIRTATPVLDIHPRSSNTPAIRLEQDASGGFTAQTWDIGANEANFFIRDVTAGSRLPFRIRPGAPSNALFIDAKGRVGVGISNPGARFETKGSVRFQGLTSCSSGIRTNGSGKLACITSSARFKTVVGDLDPQIALANVMALKPKVGAYKDSPKEPEHWLIAEETAAIDPALVGLKNGKPYTVKTQNVVADLIAVVQTQQRMIEAQNRRIDELERKLSAP